MKVNWRVSMKDNATVQGYRSWRVSMLSSKVNLPFIKSQSAVQGYRSWRVSMRRLSFLVSFSNSSRISRRSFAYLRLNHKGFEP